MGKLIRAKLGINNNNNNIRNLIFAESPVVANPIEELSARGVLHHDREVRRREHHLKIHQKLITLKLLNPKSPALIANRTLIPFLSKNLLEADDVGVAERSLVDDLPGHIPIDLQRRTGGGIANQSS